MNANNPRLIAARIIEEVLQGSSLTPLLGSRLHHLDDRDVALIKAICFGVCRYYDRLDIALSHLLSKPLRERDTDIYAILLVGLYQINEMRIPEHAAVTETVEAAKALKKPWCIALVNALLREFIRRQDAIMAVTLQEPEGKFSHPQWMLDKLQKSWPEHWQAILLANNMQPPLTVRINQQKITRNAYLEQLAAANIAAVAIAETDAGVIINQSIAIEKLPGYAAGLFSVQDAAAQLCAPLLDLSPELNVLDAAAAPGGKLTHMLELQPTLAITALDKDPIRLQMIKINLQRLQLHANCVTADAAEVSSWWDGKQFARILLDAPCTGSGVIRRHPDMKLLKKPEDVHAMVKTQQRLLAQLWPLLASDGILLYTTCSIYPEENAQLLTEFLNAHADAAEIKISTDWGLPCAVGRQILPGMQQMDGFYFAKLKKLS